MSFDIRVQNLTKVYTISHKGTGRGSMRELIEMTLRRSLAKMLGQTPTSNRPDSEEDQMEEFKALDDVSFEVAPGDRLAVVGQNGAGKSTLLKILSRITEPTAGSVEIRGRVASLLEVGTGFHPELSGRENIYLNGAVLGMPRSEIRKKFDEIVDFSEIERFLDTPVKYYSSGMYVRLAFAVAAHLDPEVLILDEVLAVGDLRFQQKCLDRMQYASREGRTVLFVSHNMQSVGQICPRSVLLEDGRVKAIGPTADVVQKYVGASFVDSQDKGTGKLAEYRPAAASVPGMPTEAGDHRARLISAAVRSAEGDIASTLLYHRKMILEMEYEILVADGTYYVPNFHIYSIENVLLFVSTPPDGALGNYQKGRYKGSFEIPAFTLNEGVFRVTLALSSWKGELVSIHFLVPNAITFKVVDDFSDVSYRNGYMHAMPGLLRPRFAWQLTRTT